MLRSPTAALAVSGALIASAVAISAGLIVDVHSGPTPTFRRQEPEPGSTSRSTDRLELAGSGSNVPLTRLLAREYGQLHPRIEVLVHDSIGSTGGVRAVADGAVDIGLLSRPLRATEDQALKTLPYARVAVVAAVHQDVADEGISSAQLVDIYRGARRTWSDGEPIVVFQRERGDSGHGAIARVLPELDAANEAAWRSDRFSVYYSDRSMEAALMQTRGSVGIADLGAIAVQRLPLRALAIDSVAPTPQALERGAYPFYKDLSLLWREPIGPAAARFVQFVRSEAGHSIIRDSGYLPIAGKAP